MIKPGKRLSLILAILWYAGIWTVSSIPAEDIPSVKIISIDKLMHISVYFILALMVNRVFSNYSLSKKYALLIYLAMLVSAGLDEYHQYYIPGRSVSVYDFIANSIGLLSGMFIYLRKHDRS
ncbi:MAG: VanZ family protein [Candidatus Cloacimonadaceae bacterium]|nr:VanZ family protein [Candidatus Cloacimonadaceae bacterium]MDP3115032.1 VanZ family protein [Candidatus Cloacimonadaceae bacterium]